MTRSMVFVLLTSVCHLAGCSNQSVETNSISEPTMGQESPAIPGVSGRFVWDRQKRPYTVIDFAEKNEVSMGVQHRNVRAVLVSPDAKSEVETVASEIYEDLRADIESAQPDAAHKRINVMIYDSLADGEAYDGSQILQALTMAGPAIPAWKDASITWNWRDPKHRPSPEQQKLFHDYWSALASCKKVAEAPYLDKNGALIVKNRESLADQMADIERRYATEKHKLVKTIVQSNGISESDFSTTLATVWLWRNGITPNPESAAESAQTFREEWSPE